MVISIENPVGINVPVKSLQTELNKQLSTKWGLTGENDPAYEAYGLIYRNKKDAGYIAEAYAGNSEYKEVYWNDELSAISWFGQSGPVEFDTRNKVKVHLIFFVNIAKLKPAIAHRGDEEIRTDVRNIIGRGLYGFSYDSTELWIENVLREYPGSRRDNRLKAVDMHPIHCFRLNLTLIYSNSNCNNPKIIL
jgi:hypothetical protein